jgi:predicted RNase H-like nuclease (RuvC/YqgF family)
VTDPISFMAIVLSLGAGGGLGFWLGRRSAGQDGAERLERAQRELQAHQARAADSARALQAKAAKDLQEARAGWETTAATFAEAQRAEIEKLTRHLTEAYDELDRLRTAAARTPQPPDTGQGFAATMPLGDL